MDRGLTFLEFMLVLAIVAIVISTLLPYFYTTGKVSYGIFGVVEERCLGGFRFVVGWQGKTSQIMDAKGHGIPCKE